MSKYTYKSKKGITLIEVMVAVAIFTICIGGFTLLFVKVWKGNSYTIEMGQSSMMVSQGTNKMINYIRSARQGDDGSYPVKTADANNLVVYSDYDRDGTTERLHFYKNGQNILMGVTDPTSTMPKSYPSGDQQTITITSSIVNTSVPIFSFYNKDYPGDVINNPMATPANVANVRLLKIHLQININPNRAPDNIEMQSFVELRNLNDYDRIK